MQLVKGKTFQLLLNRISLCGFLLFFIEYQVDVSSPRANFDLDIRSECSRSSNKGLSVSKALFKHSNIFKAVIFQKLLVPKKLEKENEEERDEYVKEVGSDFKF